MTYGMADPKAGKMEYYLHIFHGSCHIQRIGYTPQNKFKTFVIHIMLNIIKFSIYQIVHYPHSAAIGY